MGSQVHWGPAVPGLDHPPASPDTGSGSRTLLGSSGAWGPFPAVKQVCEMPVLIRINELHPPRPKILVSVRRGCKTSPALLHQAQQLQGLGRSEAALGALGCPDTAVLCGIWALQAAASSDRALSAAGLEGASPPALGSGGSGLHTHGGSLPGSGEQRPRDKGWAHSAVLGPAGRCLSPHLLSVLQHLCPSSS